MTTFIRKRLSTEFIEAVNDYTHFRTDEAFIQLPCNFGKNNSNFDYSFRNCKQNIRHRIYTQQRKKSKIRNQYSVVMLRYHFFDFDTICWLFRRSYVIVSQALRFESETKPRILISSPRWERNRDLLKFSREPEETEMTLDFESETETKTFITKTKTFFETLHTIELYCSPLCFLKTITMMTSSIHALRFLYITQVLGIITHHIFSNQTEQLSLTSAAPKHRYTHMHTFIYLNQFNQAHGQKGLTIQATYQRAAGEGKVKVKIGLNVNLYSASSWTHL